MCAKIHQKNHLSAILSFFYLFISQKSCNFAHVIELERHIEILLLSNDCVIVPNLGGFMTHHIEAHYDEQDHLFVPPLRTLGFNPMLRMNDSLLVQSYVEAYDLSYPEALRRIEEEVAELKQHLESEGSYELNDIGVLSRNEDDKLIFSPCEAGILTPHFYALSTFEIWPLSLLHQQETILETEKNVRTEKNVGSENIQPFQVVNVKEEPSIKVATKPLEPMRREEESEEKERTIEIKMSWIRNAVATAAAVIAFFLMTTPVSNSGNLSISNLNNMILMGMLPKDTNMEKIEVKRPVMVHNIIDTIKAGSPSPVASIATPKTEEPAAPKTETPATSNTEKPATPKTEKPVTPKVEKPATPKVEKPATPKVENPAPYSIILASNVSQKNADYFVKQLRQEGYKDARVMTRNNVRRVVLGHFKSGQEAYNKLSTLREMQEFKDAWVMKTQESN